MSDTTRYLSQTINYLGFLEAKLRDLQGISTLVYELVQNADDVKDELGRKTVTRITFDVRDDALLVENDGRFRPVDFARLQEIASGGKRSEAKTTGAFGLGFIAVYQVTDAPEIIASGKHWIIRPDAPTEQRILERDTEPTDDTLFRLPWAFDLSAVRRALRLDRIDPAALPQLTAEIAAALPLAALFLKQLRLLELKRNGEVVTRIEREIVPAGQLRLRQDGQETTWHLFGGDFGETAAALRAEHPYQIEEKRGSHVWLALPDRPLADGRLFATLPSQTITPLPFHLNADFYPTTDRKRILFGDDYQSEWNRAAIRAAAQTLAAHFAQLPTLLGPAALWHALQQVERSHQQAMEGILDSSFAAFWQSLIPLLSTTSIIYTSAEQWVTPAAARLTTSDPETAALPLLKALQLSIVHPGLRSYAALLRRPEINVPLLRVSDVTAPLNRLIPPQTPLHQAAPPFNTLVTWQTLWRTLDVLLRRAPTLADREQDTRALQNTPLTLTDQATLAPARLVARGNEETKWLFPGRLWLHDALEPDTIPGSLVTEFRAPQAIEHLASFSQEELETLWQNGQLDPITLYHWFESRQWEILDDPDLRQQFRQLPIFPIFDHLYPLAHLYIPGGFEDPLKLSGLLDLEPFSGRTDFLQDLGVRPLTFERYLADEVPRILQQHPDLRSDARAELVQLIASRLGSIRDDDGLRQKLRPLPLVATLDGHFRPADQVYAGRHVMAVLGNRAHIAEPASSAVQALYDWLGVAKEPKPADVLKMLLETGKEFGRTPLDDEAYRRVQNGWLFLSQALNSGQMTAADLAPLRQQPTLPDHRRRLQPPTALFLSDDSQLAAKFPPPLQKQLLPPDEATQPAFVAAGVRPLSQAARLELDPPEQAEPDTLLASRLRERRPLIARVLAAEGSPNSLTAALDALRFVRAPQLVVHHTLEAAGQTYATRPEAVPAILIAAENTLYTAHDNQNVPWAALGRVLAAHLKASGPYGGLAAGLKEVLASPTPAEAARLLDELGYPST